MQEIIKKLQEHDKRFEQIDKRFDQVDGQIDFIAKKVLEHDERFEWIKENMATRADISRVTNTLDRVVKLHESKDQEVTLLSHAVSKIEQDISKMKPALRLS